MCFFLFNIIPLLVGTTQEKGLDGLEGQMREERNESSDWTNGRVLRRKEI